VLFSFSMHGLDVIPVNILGNTPHQLDNEASCSAARHIDPFPQGFPSLIISNRASNAILRPFSPHVRCTLVRCSA
jgi:hypothetical protein